MKLCCIEGQGTRQVAERTGSIASMLENDQRLELFQMSGNCPALPLNGNHITAAFPFVKTIRLSRFPY